ncbi:MAG: hypothetical protein AAFR38_12745 [Planctomycetota bacterium]
MRGVFAGGDGGEPVGGGDPCGELREFELEVEEGAGVVEGVLAFGRSEAGHGFGGREAEVGADVGDGCGGGEGLEKGSGRGGG